jgi:peptide/nickel transport system permease protein
VRAGAAAALGRLLWWFRRDRVAGVALGVLVLIVVAVLMAPWVSPYPDQGRGVPDIANKFLAPSIEHPFGTENLGRDVLSRVLFGGRISLLIGLGVVALAALIGVPLGALAGYVGGRLDELIMRVTDVFLAFPPLLLAIAVAAALGPSVFNAVVAISVSWWPWYARIARGQAASLRQRHFVDAARAIGVRDSVIVRRHVMPHLMTPVMVQATLDVGSAILTGAALSFIGLGVQPPLTDWGVMVSSGRIYFLEQWWFALFPGLAIFVTVMALNLLGDSLRDLIDPRLGRPTLFAPIAPRDQSEAA